MFDRVCMWPRTRVQDSSSKSGLQAKRHNSPLRRHLVLDRHIGLVVVAGSTCLVEAGRSIHTVQTVVALAEAMDLDCSNRPVEDRNNHLTLVEEEGSYFGSSGNSDSGTASCLAHCMDRHRGGREEAR